MPALHPRDTLTTHAVENMPPHIGDQDLWSADRPLQEAVQREGAGWAESKLASFGQLIGQAEMFEKADAANRFTPELKNYDRYGMRIDQVQFHPAYHDLLSTAVEHGVHNFAWNEGRSGSHVAHAALTYLISQVEGGVMCSMAMSYSVFPSLMTTPALADEWLPRVRSTHYDPRDIPAGEKSGALIGMFMTEKQGGSDVRSNTTRATPLGAATGIGAPYALNGHKFFCSAPMCDAFLTLAYSDGGLSCFLVPRWRPDGTRNGLNIQRLKDKLGNRSNASSEIELEAAYGVMVGDEGRGVRTIIDMVQYNRFYCASSSAALIRQALVQATHHVSHRSAFQRRLIDQPLMRNVLADLALETEAALALTLRLGRAIDESANSPGAAGFARIGTAIAKYWVCKRAPAAVGEALECLGGAGYIEESGLPRLYREAPLNSIWEGSGNVICLDVLRAIAREPDAMPAVFEELDSALGHDANYDGAVAELNGMLAEPADLEFHARRLTELLAMTLQGSLLLRHAPAPIARAFCASRLGASRGSQYGNLRDSNAVQQIIERALQ
ncbi:MAG: acyl-CoA dehydrogenase family protein [Pseudomonadota bacterium]